MKLRYDPTQDIKRKELIRVWGNSSPDNVQYLRTLVRKLRQKLEVAPSQPKLLKSESGVGYRLERDAVSPSKSSW